MSSQLTIPKMIKNLLFKRKHGFVLHQTVCQSNAGFNNARYATLHCKIFVLLLNNNNNNYINNDDDNNNNNYYNNEEFFDVMDTRTEIGIYATEGILLSQIIVDEYDVTDKS